MGMPNRRLLQTFSQVSSFKRNAFESTAHKRARALISTKENDVSSTNNGNQPFYDNFGRIHNYLRISLTERCNLRCTYCMPEEGVPLTPKSNLLTVDEIVHLVKVFAQNGIDKVRVTGGEPTIRPDLATIVERIKSINGIKSLGMTTNGITLHRNVADLKKAGLDKINISLDTLKDDKFTEMTRRKGLQHVLRSIAAAENLYPIVKINNVVMRDKNYVEMLSFIEWTKNRRLDVRFIEYMPFGGNAFDTQKFVSYKEMMERVKAYFGDDIVRLEDDPHDTTKAYKIKGYEGQFGFITSMSENFCGTCNRLRITADGNLKVCLHGNKEVSMRDILRSGASNDEITEVIRAAVFRKKKQHADFRNGKSSAYAKSTNDSHWRMKGLSKYPIHLFPLSSSSQSIRFYSSDSKSANLLSHVASDGSAKQVDVSGKPITERIAVAQGYIKLTPLIVQQIKHNQTKKGDVLNVARLAAIMGSKQTSSLIPLCHNIPINMVSADFTLDESNCELKIVCAAKTNAQTGIEMEALTAVSIAALTVYDMCKAVSSEMVIHDIQLVSKTGGKRDYFKS